MQDTNVAEREAPAETKELTVIERAVVALGSSKHETELRELVANTASITAVKNTAGRDQAHSAAMRLKNARVGIEKTGKAARDDATQFSKAVIAEQSRLVDIVAPEEDRLFALRDAWDEARAAEKRAAVEAERQRQAAVQASIDEIRAFAVRASGKTAAQIDRLAVELDLLDVDEATFGKRLEEAIAVRLEVTATLTKMHDAAEAAESAAREAAARAEELRIEQQRIAHEQAQERAALALREQQLAEEERRARAARQAEEDAARARRDAEDIKAREALQARQRELDAQEARLREERRLADEAEAARKEEIRAREQKRLDDEAAEARRLQQLEDDRRRAEEEAAHQADMRLRAAAPEMRDALLAVYNDPASKGLQSATLGRVIAALSEAIPEFA